MGSDSLPSGFDVSMYQDGAYAGGGGFAFGIPKLTEGVGYKDPAADRHMAAILAQPIVPGGYHFARPDLNPGTSGAYAEADWFWRVATSYGGARGMLLADDAESAGGSAQWCDDFRGRLAWRLGGYQALFYSYEYWMQSRGIIGSAVLEQSALWFAWPDSNGDFPPGLTVSMQQYGLTAVPGIAGQVDANRFFGSLDQLRALTVGAGSGGFLMALDDATQQRVADQVNNLFATFTKTAQPDSESWLDVFSRIDKNVQALQGAGGQVDETKLATDIAQHLDELLSTHPVTVALSATDRSAVAVSVGNELARRLAAGTVPQGVAPDTTT